MVCETDLAQVYLCTVAYGTEGTAITGITSNYLASLTFSILKLNVWKHSAQVPRSYSGIACSHARHAESFLSASNLNYQQRTLTFKSSRLDGRGPGLREDMQDCPEKVPFPGERELLVTVVEEEVEVLAICSFGCLKNILNQHFLDCSGRHRTLPHLGKF